MPPKQKPKKIGLNEDQIRTTYNMVKSYWPDYPITLDDLHKPTKEFMFRFYTDCVNNLDDKCAFVTRSSLISHPPGLSEEELLFLKLSRIPSLKNIDFKLGDLFTFEPKRVNNHIMVIMHYLSFTEGVMDKLVQISNRVFDTKESTIKDEEEIMSLRAQKLQAQINLTSAKSQNKKHKEVAIMIAPKYEETTELIEKSNRDCSDLILEVDRLKGEDELLQEEIQKHKNTESLLREQIVSDQEYESLKYTLESLVKEEENLEEIDQSNGLLGQKRRLEQLQTCVEELTHLELCEDLYELSNLRVQLKNEQQNLKYALAVQESSETELNQMKIQLEAQKSTLQSDSKTLQEVLRKLVESNIIEEGKLKKKYQKTVQTNLEEIEEVKKYVAKQEADCKQLTVEVQKKYETICKTQEMALRYFEDFLMKVQDKMKKR